MRKLLLFCFLLSFFSSCDDNNQSVDTCGTTGIILQTWIFTDASPTSKTNYEIKSLATAKQAINDWNANCVIDIWANHYSIRTLAVNEYLYDFNSPDVKDGTSRWFIYNYGTGLFKIVQTTTGKIVLITNYP